MMENNNLDFIICPTCGENYIPHNNNEETYGCSKGHNLMNEMDKLKEKIDKLKLNINRIINIFKEIIDNIEEYYERNKNIINNYKNKN